MEVKKVFIDGEWTKGTSGKILDVENPATCEIFE